VFTQISFRLAGWRARNAILIGGVRQQRRKAAKTPAGDPRRMRGQVAAVLMTSVLSSWASIRWFSHRPRAAEIRHAMGVAVFRHARVRYSACSSRQSST